MEPTIIKGANVLMTKPEGWSDEGCASVVARRDGNAISTAWQPSPDELAALAAGGVLVLTCWGSMPPVLLTVEGGEKECTCQISVDHQNGRCIQCGRLLPT